MSINLKPIQPVLVSFWIEGTSPLIQHAWTEKALRQLRMTAAERKKQPKVARDPETEAFDCMYKTADGKPGLPMLAFKASLIGAAHKDYGIEKTLVRKALFLPNDLYDPGLIAPLHADAPEIREDIVRVGANQTDLRYRPEFNNWRVNVMLEMDPDLMTQEDLANLVNRAGFSIGLCEWRPEKGGEFGRYRLDSTQAMKAILDQEAA